MKFCNVWASFQIQAWNHLRCIKFLSICHCHDFSCLVQFNWNMCLIWTNLLHHSLTGSIKMYCPCCFLWTILKSLQNDQARGWKTGIPHFPVFLDTYHPKRISGPVFTFPLTSIGDWTFVSLLTYIPPIMNHLPHWEGSMPSTVL